MQLFFCEEDSITTLYLFFCYSLLCAGHLARYALQPDVLQYQYRVLQPGK